MQHYEDVQASDLANRVIAIVLLLDYDVEQMTNDDPAARRVGLFLDPSGIDAESHDNWNLLAAAVN